MLVAQSGPTLCNPVESHQAPLSLGFSRQGHWSGLLCPFPRDLPNPGIEPVTPALREPSGKCTWLLVKTKSPPQKPDVFWRGSILGLYIYESTFLIFPAFILFEYDHESYNLETYGPLFLVPGSYFNTVPPSREWNWSFTNSILGLYIKY